MYLVMIETSQPKHAMHTHFHSYHRNVNGASYHLVAVRGTKTWECDVWTRWTDTIKV